ncbi:hypothetical protein ER308_07255 [Egibacter rhizosphaerae]|uniref:Uncharacterized protein n=1 Tax=Egibacter rhizosphaerae TaxID=1670831 RepID=A0A411YDZ1_9ACTN|nr:hypothetical protein ER308_07255 [Egibacter rhizosphaerae]
MARRGKARLVSPSPGQARPVWAWHGLARLGTAGHGFSPLWRGMARIGAAWQGISGLGPAHLPSAWRGLARPGEPSRGQAWRGIARRGNTRLPFPPLHGQRTPAPPSIAPHTQWRT